MQNNENQAAQTSTDYGKLDISKREKYLEENFRSFIADDIHNVKLQK
jgi:tyrosine-protein phosphatase YwqE